MHDPKKWLVGQLKHYHYRPGWYFMSTNSPLPVVHVYFSSFDRAVYFSKEFVSEAAKRGDVDALSTELFDAILTLEAEERLSWFRRDGEVVFGPEK